MNTKPVDVLAAMESAADAMVDSGRFFKKSEPIVALLQARDAVAALIEALKVVKQWNDVSFLDHEWPIVMEQVNVALSKVQPK